MGDRLAEVLAVAQEAVVVHPGDTLIIRVDQSVTHAAAAEMVAALRERVDLADVVVIAGAAQLLVYRPDEPAGQDGIGSD